MVLSLRRGLLFLCTPKCASTALSEVLAPFGDVVLTGVPALKHLNWAGFQSHFGALVDQHLPQKTTLESFALMRDPLEWACSWYRYRARPFLARQDNHPHYTGATDFNGFIGALLEDEPPAFAAIGTQSSIFCDEHGKVAVDHLFPLENMDRVSRFLEEKLDAPIAVPQRNESAAGASLSLESDLEQAFRNRFAREYDIYNACRRTSSS